MGETRGDHHRPTSGPRSRTGAVVAVAVIALAVPAGAGAADPAPWWAGPTVGELPLNESGGGLFYGDCDVDPSSEGGCAPPIEIQTATSCGRNPVGLDVVPRTLRRLPGGAIAADSGEGVDVGTGNRTLTIFADTRAHATTALEQLRPRSTADPVARLPAPRYPRAVLAELRRVVNQRKKTPGTNAVAKAVGLEAGVVRTRLRLADLLPADALKGVAEPRISTKEVERRRQAVFGGSAAPGASKRTLARWKRSIRGLAGGC